MSSSSVFVEPPPIARVNVKDLILVTFAADALGVGTLFEFHTQKIIDTHGRVDRHLKNQFNNCLSWCYPGDLSHYGEMSLLLLTTLLQRRGFDLHYFIQVWHERWNSARDDAFLDDATRHTLASFNANIQYPDAASDIDMDFGHQIQWFPLVALCRNEQSFASSFLSLTRLYQCSRKPLLASELIARTLYRILHTHSNQQPPLQQQQQQGDDTDATSIMQLANASSSSNPNVDAHAPPTFHFRPSNAIQQIAAEINDPWLSTAVQKGLELAELDIDSALSRLGERRMYKSDAEVKAAFTPSSTHSSSSSSSSSSLSKKQRGRKISTTSSASSSWSSSSIDDDEEAEDGERSGRRGTDGESEDDGRISVFTALSSDVSVCLPLTLYLIAKYEEASDPYEALIVSTSIGGASSARNMCVAMLLYAYRGLEFDTIRTLCDGLNERQSIEAYLSKIH